MNETVEGQMIDVNQMSEGFAHQLPTAPSPPMPMQLLADAVRAGATKEVVDALVTLQREWDAREEREERRRTRKAFEAAMANAQAKIPPITKNRLVTFPSKSGGQTAYRHEDMAEIDRVVKPILGEYGLTYRFRPHTKINEPIRVECVISHRDGYSEETEMSAGADNSGSKNSIQAIGSTVTYLSRYLLKCALGLAASNDDDGHGVEDNSVGSDELDLLTSMLKELPSVTESNYLKVIKVNTLSDLRMSDMPNAIEKLTGKAASQDITFTPETMAKLAVVEAKLPKKDAAA